MEGLQNLVEPAIRRVLIVAAVLIGVCIAAIVLLSGCSNPCQDNPRNMQCLSVDQLKRELGANP